MIYEMLQSAHRPSDSRWRLIFSPPISAFSALGVSHVMRSINVRYLLTYLLYSEPLKYYRMCWKCPSWAITQAERRRRHWLIVATTIERSSFLHSFLLNTTVEIVSHIWRLTIVIKWNRFTWNDLLRSLKSIRDGTVQLATYHLVLVVCCSTTMCLSRNVSETFSLNVSRNVSNNDVPLKFGLGTFQGHWKWQHLTDGIRYNIISVSHC